MPPAVPEAKQLTLGFLGRSNPAGLFTNISSGVADFFIQPYDSVMMNGNKDLGVGIARGAGSLAKKTVFGFSDSLAKISGSIGKGARDLSRLRPCKRAASVEHALVCLQVCRLRRWTSSTRASAGSGSSATSRSTLCTESRRERLHSSRASPVVSRDWPPSLSRAQKRAEQPVSSRVSAWASSGASGRFKVECVMF